MTRANVVRAPRIAIPPPGTTPSRSMSAGASRTTPVSTSSRSASPVRKVRRGSVAGASAIARGLSEKRSGQSDEKGPDARRRPRAAREAYSLYVERAAEGANEADAPFSAARDLSRHRASGPEGRDEGRVLARAARHDDHDVPPVAGDP